MGRSQLVCKRAVRAVRDACRSATGRAKSVLRDVSFDLRPGRLLGVIGRTGSGKTTLARLLVRLYDPVEGKILLDGRDLRDYGVDRAA